MVNASAIPRTFDIEKPFIDSESAGSCGGSQLTCDEEMASDTRQVSNDGLYLVSGRLTVTRIKLIASQANASGNVLTFQDVVISACADGAMYFSARFD